MKKYCTIALALIGLVSVSCQKLSSDAQNNENGKNIVKTVISASIADCDDDATKTNLDPGTLKLSWAENDKLYVVAADNADLWRFNEFNIVNSSISGGCADFTSSVDMSAGTFFLALYGKRIGNKNDGLYLQGGPESGAVSYPSFGIPFLQPYCPDGPNPDYLFMRSTKDSGTTLNHFEFENLTSIMKIQVKDTRDSKATLSSITVFSNLYGVNRVPISGRFYGNYVARSTTDFLGDFKASKSWVALTGNSYGNPSISEGGSYGDAVKLNDINVPLTAEAQSFYIVVWPGSHGKISVTLTDSESNSKTLYFSTFDSHRGIVSAFPVIDLGDL